MIRIHLISFMLLTLFMSKAFNQFGTIKNGAYLNGTDFNNNKPLFEPEFRYIKKSQKCDFADDDIYASIEPCNKIDIYLVKSKNPKIKKKIINKIVWGIYENSSFYLNARKIGMAKGYIKIEKLETYSYFKGKPIKSIYQKYRLKKSAIESGLIGAGITAAIINSENKHNIHYILNMKTGMIHILNKDYLSLIIQPYSDLLLLFNLEDNNERIDVLLEYIDLINKKQ